MPATKDTRRRPRRRAKVQPRVVQPRPLTASERSVGMLVAEGLSNREVAATLGVTESTVKKHVSACIWKLGVRSRTALALEFLACPKCGRRPVPTVEHL